jgi:hypothetical protein
MSMAHRIRKVLLAAAIGMNVSAPSVAQTASKPSGGAATIIVTRTDEVRMKLATARIAVNDQSFASLDSGERHSGTVRPGPTVIVVTRWGNPGQYVARFNAQPGRTYRFQVTPRGASFAPAILFGMAGIVADAAINKDKAGEFEIHPVK